MPVVLKLWKHKNNSYIFLVLFNVQQTVTLDKKVKKSNTKTQK